jgi:inorganic pyrophosphatase
MSKPINATHYDRIPAFPDRKKKREHIVNAIIETPKRSCHKYALVPQYGIIAFHSVLPQRLEWPYDYGFVPQTIAPDGDPIDILLVNEDGLFSGCLIESRLIGAIRETKDGVENDRLIAVPIPSRGAPMPTDNYFDISDLPDGQLNEIKDFLVAYSSEQGHSIRIAAVVGAKDALAAIKRCMKQFRKKMA